MNLVFHWFLPTSGDGRGIVGGGALNGRKSPTVTRPPTIEYLAQVARSAEQLGFTGVLTPTGTWCEDAWLATAALITATSRLKFLVAFRPGLISPTLAAQMAASYQRISRGRLLLNVVTGGQAMSDTLNGLERLAETTTEKSIIVWLNEFFGEVTKDGKTFEEFKIAEDLARNCWAR